MSLSCDCDSYADFWHESEHTARVSHTCYECKLLIKPRETYRKEVGVWYGDFDHFKLCESCMNLADSLHALGFCWNYGDLLYAHQQYIEIYQPPKLLR